MCQRIHTLFINHILQFFAVWPDLVTIFYYIVECTITLLENVLQKNEYVGLSLLDWRAQSWKLLHFSLKCAGHNNYKVVLALVMWVTLIFMGFNIIVSSCNTNNGKISHPKLFSYVQKLWGHSFFWVHKIGGAIQLGGFNESRAPSFPRSVIVQW